MSKDFGKLSYQQRPSVTKRRYSSLMAKFCPTCDALVAEPGVECPDCRTKLVLKKTRFKGEGMVCPHCNNLAMPYKPLSLNVLDEEDVPMPLDFADFANHKTLNDRCYYCDAELWEPHVANLGTGGKHRVWNRATHYANRAHKGKVTVWVHEKYQAQYFHDVGEEPLNMRDGNDYRGVRKYSPAEFIKRYMRGFFDFAVFDEAHLCVSS